jgi:hypothetical protein
MRPIISGVLHKARHSRTREDNHKQLQTTVVLLRVIPWPRGLDLDLDSGLEQKHQDVSRPRHLDGGFEVEDNNLALDTSTAASTLRQRPRHLDGGLAPRQQP